MFPETVIFIKLLITKMCNRVWTLGGNKDLVPLFGVETKLDG